MTSASLGSQDPLYLFGNSEIRKIAQTIDWSHHPMGAVENWDQNLKIILSTINNSKFPMFVAWGKERYFFYNDAYAPILGIKHPGALGQRFQEIWSEIWNDLLPLVTSVDKGEAHFLEDLKLMMNRKGYQEETYFTFSYSPIFSSQNQVEGLYCACVETTSRILAERKLQIANIQTENARRDLYSFFMQAPVPMVILEGPEHKVTLANPLYEKLAGRTVMGKTIAEAFDAGEAKNYIPMLDSVFQTGKPVIGHFLPLELPNEAGEVKKLWIDLGYHAYLDDDGKIKGVLAIVHDVTDQYLAKEELENTIKLRDEFLSLASHELKTPLTTLKLQSQMLKRMVDKSEITAIPADKVLSFSEQADKQVQRLTRLIDDMLDISRIRTGKLTITKEKFDLVSLVKDVAKRMDSQFHSNNYQTPVLRLAAEAVGCWDPLRLEQVLINLFTNAIRYGQKNEIIVELISNPDDVILTVTDHGVGVADEDKQRIFERFQRVSTQYETNGLGLGLFLTKQIIGAHEGEVWVESELGKGSSFHIRLPRDNS